MKLHLFPPPNSAHFGEAGQEGLDVDVGVVNFEVVVAEPARHADGRQHPSLGNQSAVASSRNLSVKS